MSKNTQTEETYKPLGLEIDRSNSNDIKKKFKIEGVSSGSNFIEYTLDIETIPEEMKYAIITCDSSDVVQKVLISYVRDLNGWPDLSKFQRLDHDIYKSGNVEIIIDDFEDDYTMTYKKYVEYLS